MVREVLFIGGGTVGGIGQTSPAVLSFSISSGNNTPS
jgi:hypothetical protein